MNQARRIGSEIGTAFAVLALYLLIVLAPLHQARASQLAFAELGYAPTQASWVLCTPAGVPDPDGAVSVAKCPATGVGKAELAPPAVDAVPIRHDSALRVPLLASQPAILPRAIAPPAGPRAPPVLV